MYLTISVPARPCFDGLVYTLTQTVSGPLVYSWTAASQNVSACYYAGDSMTQTPHFGCARVGSFSPGWFADAFISGTWPNDGRDRCFFGAPTVTSVNCATKTVVFGGTLVTDGFGTNPCASPDPYTLTVNP